MALYFEEAGVRITTRSSVVYAPLEALYEKLVERGEVEPILTTKEALSILGGLGLGSSSAKNVGAATTQLLREQSGD